ncbi:hypothetical protein LCGC14_1957450, partial [marine sediment metagenome]
MKIVIKHWVNDEARKCLKENINNFLVEPFMDFNWLCIKMARANLWRKEGLILKTEKSYKIKVIQRTVIKEILILNK